MTIKEILTQFDRIHEDSSYFCIDDEEEKYICLTIEDFMGFDKDYHEVFRKLKYPDLIDEVLGWLKDEADEIDKDYITHYMFDDIDVCVMYASDGIQKRSKLNEIC